MSEYLNPDSIIQSTEFVGAISTIQNSPDNLVDLTWLTASTTSSSPTLRVSFPTPSQTLYGLQEFRVKVKKRGGTGTPTVVLALYENGVLVTQSSPFNITSILSQVIRWTWSSAGRDAANIEMNLVATNSGGTAGVRATVDVAAVSWSAITVDSLTNSEQIQGILNNTSMSVSDRKRQAATFKSEKILEALPSTMANDLLEITFTKPPTVGNGRLEVYVSAKRNGITINIPPGALPFIFVNPPIIHQGVEDPLTAAREIITQTVSRYG